MAKYRKKPVVIEAMQLKEDNILQMEEFIEDKKIEIDGMYASAKFEDYKNTICKKGRIIKTLEGNMRADMGDYIIKGVQGEFYPCKPDIFHKTYEKVGD